VTKVRASTSAGARRVILASVAMRNTNDRSTMTFDHDIGNATDASRALFAACRAGCANSVPQWCASALANEDRGSQDVSDALVCASAHGHAACVSALLACDGVSASSSALVAACAAGHEACTSLLLDRGAIVDGASPSGLTPLAVACAGGHDACVDLLLDYGARADRPGAMPHELDICPPPDAPAPPCGVCLGILVDEVSRGRRGVARRWCTCGADARALHVTMRRARASGSLEALHVQWAARVVGHAANATVRAGAVLHPLKLAARGGHVTCARILIQRAKADLVPLGTGTSTPLTIACARGHTEVVRMLLEAVPADPRVTHRNALAAACNAGHAACARLLLAAGATGAVQSVITHPLVRQHAECFDLLVDAGAVPPCTRSHRDRYGVTPPVTPQRQRALENVLSTALRARSERPWTRAEDQPLMVAARNGEAVRLRRLLRQGDDVNQRDWLGRTALHHLLKHNDGRAISAECVTLLCAHGAIIDDGMAFPPAWEWVRDACKAGPTPLHRLRLQAKTKDVMRMLRAGWDVDAPGGTEDAPTPIDVARQFADDPEMRSRARLLLAAARWSPRWYFAFPKEVQDQAWAQLALGEAVADRLGSHALLDVWKSKVMPQAVVRRRRAWMVDASEQCAL